MPSQGRKGLSCSPEDGMAVGPVVKIVTCWGQTPRVGYLSPFVNYGVWEDVGALVVPSLSAPVSSVKRGPGSLRCHKLVERVQDLTLNKVLRTVPGGRDTFSILVLILFSRAGSPGIVTTLICGDRLKAERPLCHFLLNLRSSAALLCGVIKQLTSESQTHPWELCGYG